MNIRTVVDLRARNDNTKKMVSPLPDIDGILSRIGRHKYLSSLDGKDFFEQIRVDPEDVRKTLMVTPDGTVVSLVMQMGDCNAPTTCQTLMNYIFREVIGVFVDVYLDDIIIYSDTVEEHTRHCRTVIGILQKHHLYLSRKKAQFFVDRVKILGHTITPEGIMMDSDKVDSIVNWKVPTNPGLLSSFLGAVGFLAPDCAGVRIPMGVLAPLTGSKSIWEWRPIHQRAFDEVKAIVEAH